MGTDNSTRLRQGWARQEPEKPVYVERTALSFGEVVLLFYLNGNSAEVS
jgi:hypothetical protein